MATWFDTTAPYIDRLDGHSASARLDVLAISHNKFALPK